MDRIFREIAHAVSTRCFYMAIMQALALPDICAALSTFDGRTRGALYKSWYNDNFAHRCPWLTDDDCYSLRCGVVHQGRLGFPGSDFARVIFVIDQPGIHMNIMDDVLQLSAETFCKDMIDAAQTWFERERENGMVKANLVHLVQYHENGLQPFFSGTPVIA